jgi:hypothetical protein
MISRCNIGVGARGNAEGAWEGKEWDEDGQVQVTVVATVRSPMEMNGRLTYAKPAHDIPSKVGPRTTNRSIEPKMNVNE